MRTNVRFETDKFGLPKKSDEPNSPIELADWLVENFSKEFQLDYIVENYHCILTLGDPLIKNIRGGCGHVENNVWQVFMQMKPSIIDKLFKKTMPIDLQVRFLSKLDALLKNSDEFYNIEWYAEDSRLQEYDHAGSFSG